MCAELADLAMQLARAAAARALTDRAEPEPPPAAEPQSIRVAEPQSMRVAEPQPMQAAEPQPMQAAEPQPMQAAEPQPMQAAEPQPLQAAEPLSLPAAAAHPTRETAPRPPTIRIASPRQIDPALLFTRLAAVVRDCITLEARLAAAATDTRGPHPLTPRADPRRAPLREILDLATQNHPGRAALNREITTRLEEHLAADPYHTVNPAQILDAICDEFAIDLDLAKVSDDHLDVLCGTEDDPDDDFDPRATSPP